MPDVPNLDIRPDHWRIVSDILRKHVPQYAVWAFGSRAKWTAKQYSDLDLAVITDKPLSLEVSASLADDFSESDLPWKVDVVDWATTSESFRKIIERDKVVVQKPVMASEWERVSLDELYEFSSGLSKPRSEFGSGYPFLSFKDVFHNSAVPKQLTELVNSTEQERIRCSVSRGDVFLTRTSETMDELGMSSVALADIANATFNGFTKRLRPKHPKRVAPEFARYYFRCPAFRSEVDAMSSMSTRASLNNEMLARLTIVLPPFDEQEDIGQTLGTLDDRIDNLRQTNATLEAIATALFKSWFVDFDGVPPEDMQESELGLIPKGWRVGTLVDLCEVNTAKWTDKNHPPTVGYIDLSGVSSNRIEAITEYAFDEAPSRARMHLREGDTIVGMVRPGNRAFAYIHVPDASLTGSTGFAVLSPKRPHYASFIYLAVTRDEAIERLANLADGAAYPAVRPNVVAETPCVIAPDEVIAKFSAVTKPMLERIEPNSQQAATLAAVRDTLLPRLISGRLRIKAAA